jgi:hypothetical protein
MIWESPSRPERVGMAIREAEFSLLDVFAGLMGGC